MPKSSLRQTFRQQRQDLTDHQQAEHAGLLSSRLQTFLLPLRSPIGFYWPNDGEISPLPFLQYCLSQEIDCYLPLIQSGNKTLRFGQILSDTTMKKNQYAIPEPVDTPILSIDALAVLLLPLVAFDDKGHRLGMGGGFYDYTLAASQTKPTLVGLAHQCQQATSLPTEDWDHPLDVVVTEQQLVQFAAVK